MRRSRLFGWCGALSAFIASIPAASASETVTYSYDALGRLVTTVVSNGPANGVQTTTAYDPAGNRTNQTTTGAANPPAGNCSFAAVSVEGTDEFSVYPYLTKSGECPPVTVSANIQIASGYGEYYVYPPYTGNYDLVFNQGETYEVVRIGPYYGTVAPGNPLVLHVTWTITSGSGTFTNNLSVVTIWNSDCYC